LQSAFVQAVVDLWPIVVLAIAELAGALVLVMLGVMIEHDVMVLGAYAIGALHDDVCAAVDRHLISCPTCAAEVDTLIRLRSLLDLLRPNDAGPG
jgi:anti-sigma factor RsiW